MFLSSKDSSNLFSKNNYKDFWVEFDHEIVLEEQCAFGFRQQWSFALTEIYIDLPSDKQTLPEPVVILCDLCTPSYINSNQVQVLRTVSGAGDVGTSLGLTHYIGLNKTRFNRIRIQVVNRDLKTLTKSSGWPDTGDLRCTLHFTRS